MQKTAVTRFTKGNFQNGDQTTQCLDKKWDAAYLVLQVMIRDIEMYSLTYQYICDVNDSYHSKIC